MGLIQETCHGSNNGSGPSQAATVVNAPAAANSLILSFAGLSENLTPSSVVLASVTDSKGNTWTIDQQGSSNTAPPCAVASTPQDVGTLTAEDTITVNVTQNGGGTNPYIFAVHEVSDLLRVGTRVDVKSTLSQSSNLTSRTGGTTAATGGPIEFVWAAFAVAGTETSFAAGAGYSQPTTKFYAANSISVEFEYKTTSATGTQNPTGTGGIAKPNRGCTVVYKTVVTDTGTLPLTGSPTSSETIGDSSTGQATGTPAAAEAVNDAATSATTNAATATESIGDAATSQSVGTPAAAEAVNDAASNTAAVTAPAAETINDAAASQKADILVAVDAILDSAADRLTITPVSVGVLVEFAATLIAATAAAAIEEILDAGAGQLAATPTATESISDQVAAIIVAAILAGNEILADGDTTTVILAATGTSPTAAKDAGTIVVFVVASGFTRTRGRAIARAVTMIVAAARAVTPKAAAAADTIPDMRSAATQVTGL